MMLKKQTVWLLTMLSLMIVLSVYYMTSPNEDQVAFIENNNTEDVDNNAGSETMDGDIVVETNSDQQSVISSLTSDEMFTSIRMEILDERNRTREQLSNIVASSDVSTEEKNSAMEQMRALEAMSTKESILERTIQASAQYQDVLVRAEDNVVHVTVKANELSKTEANNIIQQVRDEFGEITVNVKFQPYE